MYSGHRAPEFRRSFWQTQLSLDFRTKRAVYSLIMKCLDSDLITFGQLTGLESCLKWSEEKPSLIIWIFLIFGNVTYASMRRIYSYWLTNGGTPKRTTATFSQRTRVTVWAHLLQLCFGDWFIYGNLARHDWRSTHRGVSRSPRRRCGVRDTWRTYDIHL